MSLGIGNVLLLITTRFAATAVHALPFPDAKSARKIGTVFKSGARHVQTAQILVSLSNLWPTSTPSAREATWEERTSPASIQTWRSGWLHLQLLESAGNPLFRKRPKWPPNERQFSDYFSSIESNVQSRERTVLLKRDTVGEFSGKWRNAICAVISCEAPKTAKSVGRVPSCDQSDFLDFSLLLMFSFMFFTCLLTRSCRLNNKQT